MGTLSLRRAAPLVHACESQLGAACEWPHVSQRASGNAGVKKIRLPDAGEVDAYIDSSQEALDNLKIETVVPVDTYHVDREAGDSLPAVIETDCGAIVKVFGTDLDGCVANIEAIIDGAVAQVFGLTSWIS